MMEYVELGSSGLKVSALALGTAFRGGLVEEMPNVIRRALDLGINIMDTGGYERGGVRTEAVIGEVIKERRSDVVLAVKIYPPIMESIEDRFETLNVDYIDILQVLPIKNGPHIPIDDAVREAEQLVKDGRVGHVGVARYTLPQLREAQEALTPASIVSDQLQYSLITRGIEDEILPYCKRKKISILAYSPLAIGLLSGDPRTIDRYRDSMYEWYRPENVEKNRSVLEVLREVGRQRDKTAAQVALNWILCKGDIIPITGPDTVSQLEENCGAAGWRLDASELSAIDEAAKAMNVRT